MICDIRETILYKYLKSYFCKSKKEEIITAIIILEDAFTDSSNEV